MSFLCGSTLDCWSFHPLFASGSEAAEGASLVVAFCPAAVGLKWIVGVAYVAEACTGVISAVVVCDMVSWRCLRRGRERFDALKLMSRAAESLTADRRTPYDNCRPQRVFHSPTLNLMHDVVALRLAAACIIEQ